MILVDASNAFNRLNRQATLLNCRAICPALSYILINTYRNNSQLFVDGQCILSKEGTTQGDPLAMAMYATGTQPLIRRLDGIAKQVWYADDSAAGSSIENLKRWWDLLVEIGPLYGYFPNGSKTHILAKPQHAEAAREIFKDTGIYSYHNRRRAVLRGSNWISLVCSPACGTKSGLLEKRARKARQICRHSTSCCVRCLHSRTLLKVDLPSTGN